MNAVSRFGVAVILATILTAAALPADGATVSPPLLIAPEDADVQSVARAFHRVTGFPLVVVYDGRHVPPGVALDTPRRMRLRFWRQGQEAEWKPWGSVAAAVGETGPSQLLIFGDTSLIPDRWLEGIPSRFPRVRFLGNEDAVGWLQQAQTNAGRLVVRRRESARREAALAAQRTTSVVPSAAKGRPPQLLAMPPKWDVDRPAPRPPEPAVSEAEAPPAEDVATAEPADVQPEIPIPDEPAPPPVDAETPEPVMKPGLDGLEPADAEPKTDTVGATPVAEASAADAAAAEPGGQAPEPAVEASPAPAPVERSPAGSEAPRASAAGSSYGALRDSFTAVEFLIENDTGNVALPRVRTHVERTLDWAQQLQLARDGNYPNTALAAREKMQREVDRLRSALAEYREDGAATSAQIAELKAEKLDFGAVDWPRAGADQARAAAELASFRAGDIDTDGLRADEERYAALRFGLALEEEIERRVAAFETAARSFAR